MAKFCIVFYILFISLLLRQLQNALRIGTVTRCYCWKGTSIDAGGSQIDLVVEWHGERTDYLCEIKFSENKFSISADYKQNLLDKISAFNDSAQHVKSHSILLAMVTTMGIKQNAHSDCVNVEVTLDSLFD